MFDYEQMYYDAMSVVDRLQDEVEELRAEREHLMAVAKAVCAEEHSEHREWDHSKGCPLCDATRAKHAALAALPPALAKEVAGD